MIEGESVADEKILSDPNDDSANHAEANLSNDFGDKVGNRAVLIGWRFFVVDLSVERDFVKEKLQLRATVLTFDMMQDSTAM